MTLFDLDRAIWHVVPHFFEDGCGERLKYDRSCGQRLTALLRAGEYIFFNGMEGIPDWVPGILKQAYKDLKTHGRLVFEDDEDYEYLLGND
jgi:hypothetical protein